MNKKYVFTNWIMGAWKSGRVMLEVISVGHKWVWVKPTGRKQFLFCNRRRGPRKQSLDPQHPH